MPIESVSSRSMFTPLVALAMVSAGCTSDPVPRIRLDSGPGQRADANRMPDSGAILDFDSGGGADFDSGGGSTFDSGVPSDIGPVPDTGPGEDAGPTRDTGSGSRDTGPARDTGRVDAGTGEPVTVDGLLREAFWDGAVEQAPKRSGSGIWAGLNFDHFYAVRTRTTLYFGFAGTFPSASSAVIVYLDVNYGSANGVMLTPTGLSDRSAGIGAVLSNPITSIDMAFLPDFGWGAGRRPEPATTGTSTIGWRSLEEIGTHPMVAMGRNACTLNACETSISLTALGITSTAPIAYVMRVGDVNTLGSFATGLTIPMDEPAFITGVVGLSEK